MWGDGGMTKTDSWTLTQMSEDSFQVIRSLYGWRLVSLFLLLRNYRYKLIVAQIPRNEGTGWSETTPPSGIEYRSFIQVSLGSTTHWGAGHTNRWPTLHLSACRDERSSSQFRGDVWSAHRVASRCWSPTTNQKLPKFLTMLGWYRSTRLGIKLGSDICKALTLLLDHRGGLIHT